MFDTLLIITLFLQASLLACLLTLRSSINIKHLCLFFHSLPILTDFLKFQPPPSPFIYFDPPPPPPPPRLLNLTKISDPPFIRHLRVLSLAFIYFHLLLLAFIYFYLCVLCVFKKKKMCWYP